MICHTLVKQSIHTATCFLIILLAPIRCTCNKHPKPPSTSNRLEITQPPQRTGIWHTYTGTHEEKNILQATPPSYSQIPQLYTTYDMYQVNHDGSCGFRAFLPILLNEILVDKKWKSWLENLRTTIYELAKQIVETVDLTNTKYMEIRPPDDPDKLIQDTKDLLQKLDVEPTARKLEETEIQLLVKFMRQIMLMNFVIHSYNEIVKGNSNSFNISKFEEEFSKSLTGINRTNNFIKEFWVEGIDFIIFGIPYFLLIDPDVDSDNDKKIFSCLYFLPPDNTFPDFDRSDLSFEARLSTSKFPDFITPSIIMYQHGQNGIMFEYLVPKDKK